MHDHAKPDTKMQVILSDMVKRVGQWFFSYQLIQLMDLSALEFNVFCFRLLTGKRTYIPFGCNLV